MWASGAEAGFWAEGCNLCVAVWVGGTGEGGICVLLFGLAERAKGEFVGSSVNILAPELFFLILAHPVYKM